MSGHCLTVGYSSVQCCSKKACLFPSARNLSRAIREKDYRELQDLLLSSNDNDSCPSCCCGCRPPEQKMDSPLWKSNAKGWTPMHTAAIASPEMPLHWWNWILLQQQQQQQQQQPHSSNHHPDSLWKKQTDTGRSVLELFFTAWLFPSPWFPHSLKERAKDRNKALQCVLETPTVLDALKDSIWKENYDDDEDENDLLPVVSLVLDFWRRLEILLQRTILSVSSEEQPVLLSRRQQTLFALCNLPWCPPMVGKLAIALCHGSEQQEQQQLSCLHTLVRSMSAEPHFMAQHTGILSEVCQSFPIAARLPDPRARNRLPLHHGLSSGLFLFDSKGLDTLLEAYPKALEEKDPLTGLPCFALVGLVVFRTDQIESIAKDQHESLRSCWKYLSQSEIQTVRERTQEGLDALQVSTVYRLLQQDPSVLSSSGGN